MYPVALGAAAGILKLYGSGTAASLLQGWAGISSAHWKFVPVVTLDGIMAGRFGGEEMLLLVDVEGAELQVLKGATGLLERTPKPVWVVEICIGEHQPGGLALNPHLAETFEMFWHHGYEVTTFDDHRRVVTREDIARIIASGEDHLKVHNYLCMNLDQGLQHQGGGSSSEAMPRAEA